MLRWARQIGSYRGSRVLLWENTHRNNVSLPVLARTAGFAILAMPQNMEALWETTAVRRKMAAFADELAGLAVADAVFCISREEQWLLRNFGIAADFLPYFPPRLVRARLLAVRDRRRFGRGASLLILGTAHNPPTRAGMKSLLRMLRSLPGGDQLPLQIAGFGTESLRADAADLNCQVHGGLDQVKLDELLVDARAAVIHQDSATGALTRIPELLLAGIPVIANSIAARSATHYAGVHLYQSPQSLLRLLRHPLETPPTPEPPVEAEGRFLAVLRAVITGESFVPSV